MRKYLFTTKPMLTTMGETISNTPYYMEESTTASPVANQAYNEGREAFRAGAVQEDNPYRDNHLNEFNVLWTAEDIWELGYTTEKELHDR